MAQETCESWAVGRTANRSAGAAKTSFMQKCKRDTCAAKAVASAGKKLSGAAKTSFMKKCEAGASTAAKCGKVANVRLKRRR